MKDDARRQR